MRISQFVISSAVSGVKSKVLVYWGGPWLQERTGEQLKPEGAPKFPLYHLSQW
jgi:hypothetical protein